MPGVFLPLGAPPPPVLTRLPCLRDQVGICGKYGTRYGSSLRKVVKKIEVLQHSKVRPPHAAPCRPCVHPMLQRGRDLAWASNLAAGARCARPMERMARPLTHRPRNRSSPACSAARTPSSATRSASGTAATATARRLAAPGCSGAAARARMPRRSGAPSPHPTPPRPAPPLLPLCAAPSTVCAASSSNQLSPLRAPAQGHAWRGAGPMLLHHAPPPQ